MFLSNSYVININLFKLVVVGRRVIGQPVCHRRQIATALSAEIASGHEAGKNRSQPPSPSPSL